MPKFLNTQGLSEWIPRIIEETERELVIITPYMQLSDKIFNLLVKADKRGVETIIIYRENKLSEKEKEKLKSIDNLNLMHHPNLHAKCYYNENYLLVASMNLYEYSEKNNREMGVLLHKISIPEFDNNDPWGDNPDDDTIFEDAIQEIIEIVNGSHLEKKSRETLTDCFEMKILKTAKEKAEESLNKINKAFIHKKFKLEEEGFGNYKFVCKSYMDKVDVIMGYRIEFKIQIDEKKLTNAFQNFQKNRDQMEFSIKGFKLYWNRIEELLLYDDSKHYYWKKAVTKENTILLRKKGIDDVIEFIKSF
ncbi:MAG: phospholipase D family protein [Flavobacterium sp.]|nr:phospholipase D family protein [Flavobacterium sp.]